MRFTDEQRREFTRRLENAQRFACKRDSFVDPSIRDMYERWANEERSFVDSRYLNLL